MDKKEKTYLKNPKRIHLINQHRSEQHVNRGFQSLGQNIVINTNLTAFDQSHFNDAPTEGMKPFTPIKLAEMDSTLDKVYEKRVLRVTTIEDPLLGWASLHLLVEDEDGAVIVLCVYNVPQDAETCVKFAFGKEFEVLNPYHRIAMDRSIILRVDDPQSIRVVGEKPDMCRYCGEMNAPKSCGQCKRAKYCSKECQTSDWKLLKHKNVCFK